MLNNIKTIKRFFRSEAGSMAAMGAAALIMLIICAGSVIDIARFVNVKSKFKNAIDSALLSAVAVSRSQDIDEVAEKFFYANFPPEYLQTTELSAIDVVPDPATLSWTITATGRVKTMFAAMVGFTNIEVSHKAKIAWDVNKHMEIVFTLDSSSSMCTDTVRSPEEDDVYIVEYRPDYTCGKLNAMKEAMRYMIDNGLVEVDGVGGPVFNVGIVPFNHKVRLPNPDAAPAELTQSEATLDRGDADYFKDLDDAEPLSAMVPLLELTPGSRAQLHQAINDISQSPLGLGWTRSNVAVLTSALLLDSRHNGAFGGAGAAPFNPDATDKIVIMMTDGANVGCCYAAHPEGNFGNQYLYLYEPDNAHLTGLDKQPRMHEWAGKYGIANAGLCDTMKEAGIVIYSVVLDVDDRDAGGAAIKDVYKDCASNDQFFFDIQNEEDLVLAYKTISQSLLRLRITY